MRFCLALMQKSLTEMLEFNVKRSSQSERVGVMGLMNTLMFSVIELWGVQLFKVQITGKLCDSRVVH